MAFKRKPTLEQLNHSAAGTLTGHLGIECTAIGDDWLEARMPVDSRTINPLGILHGGASVVLAETLGSIASVLCIDPEKQKAVGLEINANHLRSVRGGWVKGRVQPLHLGRSTHVWEIRIQNEDGALVCISRLTVAII